MDEGMVGYDTCTGEIYLYCDCVRGTEREEQDITRRIRQEQEDMTK
jgi:hypothetical protein